MAVRVRGYGLVRRSSDPLSEWAYYQDKLPDRVFEWLEKHRGLDRPTAAMLLGIGYDRVRDVGVRPLDLLRKTEMRNGPSGKQLRRMSIFYNCAPIDLAAELPIGLGWVHYEPSKSSGTFVWVGPKGAEARMRQEKQARLPKITRGPRR